MNFNKRLCHWSLILFLTALSLLAVYRGRWAERLVLRGGVWSGDLQHAAQLGLRCPPSLGGSAARPHLPAACMPLTERWLDVFLMTKHQCHNESASWSPSWQCCVGVAGYQARLNRLPGVPARCIRKGRRRLPNKVTTCCAHTKSKTNYSRERNTFSLRVGLICVYLRELLGANRFIFVVNHVRNDYCTSC